MRSHCLNVVLPIHELYVTQTRSSFLFVAIKMKDYNLTTLTVALFLHSPAPLTNGDGGEFAFAV